MLFLIGNLFLLCENLKGNNNLKNKNNLEVTDLSYKEYKNEEVFKNIEDVLNLAYFQGTHSLDVFNDEITLTLNKEYFKYVLDELKEIIDIASIEYLDDEFVLMEGVIK